MASLSADNSQVGGICRGKLICWVAAIRHGVLGMSVRSDYLGSHVDSCLVLMIPSGEQAG
jgi:hypothetical protein